MASMSPMAGGKISDQLAARLDRLEPGDGVRAVILLKVAWPDGAAPTRGSRERREVARDAVRRSAGAALPEIDRLLETYGGRRLAEEPDALGSVPVETSPAGIRALARCEAVSAILEDQPISLAP